MNLRILLLLTNISLNVQGMEAPKQQQIDQGLKTKAKIFKILGKSCKTSGLMLPIHNYFFSKPELQVSNSVAVASCCCMTTAGVCLKYYAKNLEKKLTKLE